MPGWREIPKQRVERDSDVAVERHARPEGTPQLRRVDVQLDGRLTLKRQGPVLARVLADLAAAPEHEVCLVGDLEGGGRAERIQDAGGVRRPLIDRAFAGETGGHRGVDSLSEVSKLRG